MLRTKVCGANSTRKKNIERVYAPICGSVPYMDDDNVSQFMNNIDKCGCRGEGQKHNEFNDLNIRPSIVRWIVMCYD